MKSLYHNVSGRRSTTITSGHILALHTDLTGKKERMSALPGVTYGDLIVEALSRYRTREAFVQGDRRLTYGESAEIIRHFMAAFRACGLRAGDGVAALSPNSPESWLAQAATYLLGGHFSGLQLLASLEDHIFVCNDAPVDVLVTAESHVDHAREIAAKAPSVREVIVVPSSGRVDLRDGSSPLPHFTAGPAGEEDVAWLQYTGGTTGRPKGAMIPQRGLVYQAASYLASCGVPEEPRYLAASPITHGAVLPIMPTLLRGGTVVLLSAFDPEEWADTVQKERINYAFVVPTMIYKLLDDVQLEDYNLSSLETVAYGAAPMSPARLVEAQERIGNVFLQVYGQTETGAIATTLRRDEHDADNPDRLASCGRAVVGTLVAVLNDDGEPVKIGGVGEICVRSRSAMLAYRNMPEETAAVLRDGWVRTGDMGRQDEDGFFYLVDRKRDMIISGGFNVFAREVEDVVTRHPSVASAAVIGVPDDKWGEAVAAIVVLRDGHSLDSEDLSRFVKDQKGKLYAPKMVKFVDDLPTTAVGKVDKMILRAPYWEGQERQVH